MKAVIALGSNLGDRLAHLNAGIEALHTLGEVKASPMTMETPDESGQGPAYLNTVVELDCAITDVRKLLEALLRIELQCGRDRTAGKNAPRTLDLDLIEVTGVRGAFRWTPAADLAPHFEELFLELPHPRASTRMFVMEPWKALKDEKKT